MRGLRWEKRNWVRLFPRQYHFAKPSLVVRFHLYFTLIILMPLLSGQAGENWDPSDKAKLFRIGEHWPETYLHDIFLFSEALRVYMGCEIQRKLQLHGLLLLYVLILRIRQHTYSYLLVYSYTLMIHTRTYNTQEHTKKTGKRKYSNG